MTNMSKRCLPYTIFEWTLAAAVIWIVVTTIGWTWLLRYSLEPEPEVCQKDNTRYHEPIHVEDIRRDPIKTNRRNNNMPVYIVEEHHEVLPYWFGAANRGLLPKSGNTLVHIDAHPDGALSEIQSLIPDFRFPRSAGEIALMIQENDGFIQSSMITGLFNRWIYIWSAWDDEQVKEIGYYRKETVHMGRLKGAPWDSNEPLCQCLEVPEFPSLKDCVHYRGFRGMNMTPIEQEQCDIKATFVHEEVSEKAALDLLASGSWLSPEENIVLDIDEDYYGCEAAVMPLWNLGISDKKLEVLQAPLGKLFCPKDSQEEQRFDKIFHLLLSRIASFNDTSSTRSNKTAFIERVMDEVARLIEVYDVSDALCTRSSNNEYFQMNLKYLTMKLMKMTREQLEVLGEVGLCLHTTPQSIHFERESGITTCDGYNRPGDSMVFFHTPTPDEIKSRTQDLKKMLLGIHDPKLITICRSMRDGYTPKKFFHKIEADVLDLLVDRYPAINGLDSVHYDIGLLGGRYGWPDRHQSS